MPSPSGPLNAQRRTGYVNNTNNKPTTISVYVGDDSQGSGGTTPQELPYCSRYDPLPGDYVVLLGVPGDLIVLDCLASSRFMATPNFQLWPRSSALAHDDVAQNAFVVIMDATWNSASAGRYLIGGNMAIDNTGGNAVAYGRLTANGQSLVVNGSSEDWRIDLVTTLTKNVSVQADYDHTGGNLHIQLLYNDSGTVGRVATAGTNLWALGPFPTVP